MVSLDRTAAFTHEDVLIPERGYWAIDLDKIDTGTWGAQSAWPRQHGVIYLLTKVQAGRPETQPMIIQFRFDLTMFRSLASWVPSPAGLSRTFGACSAGHGDNADEQWILRNKRRVYLINKRLEGSLTTEEARELQQLQADMERYLDAVAPLPTQAEEYVRLIAGTSAEQKE